MSTFLSNHVPHFHGSLVVAHKILDRFYARFTKANKHKNVVSFHEQQLSDLKLFCGAFLGKKEARVSHTQSPCWLTGSYTGKVPVLILYGLIFNVNTSYYQSFFDHLFFLTIYCRSSYLECTLSSVLACCRWVGNVRLHNLHSGVEEI